MADLRQSPAGRGERRPAPRSRAGSALRPAPRGGAWRTIWTDPRLAVRQAIRGDAAGFVIAVACLSGVAAGIEIAAFSSAERYRGVSLLFVSLTMGPAFVITYFGFAGSILAGVGRLLGGTSDVSDTRVAMALGALPELIALPLWIPVIGFYGLRVFTTELTPTPVAIVVFKGVLLALYVWAWILRIVTLAEVHRFSVWRSLATVVLGWLAAASVVVGIFAGVVALSGR